MDDTSFEEIGVICDRSQEIRKCREAPVSPEAQVSLRGEYFGRSTRILSLNGAQDIFWGYRSDIQK